MQELKLYPVVASLYMKFTKRLVQAAAVFLCLLSVGARTKKNAHDSAVVDFDQHRAPPHLPQPRAVGVLCSNKSKESQILLYCGDLGDR